MKLISDYDLILPELGDANDFPEVYMNTDDSLKETVTVLERVCNLLRGIDDKKASAERIAWLNIWTKVYQALYSCISAFQNSSILTMQSISRSSFEWSLQTLFLFQPIKDFLNTEKKADNIKINIRSIDLYLKQTLNRLRAYTAWCLWCDHRYYMNLLKKESMDGLWDFSKEEKIAENEESLERYEELFGRLDAFSKPDELSSEQTKWQNKIRDKIKKIDNLFEDPSIKPWVNKIKAGKPNLSFFKLFDKSLSVWKYVNDQDALFSYSIYSMNSMILHGSTMEQFVHINDSIVVPMIKPSHEKIKNELDNAVSFCNHIAVGLAAIEHYILKRNDL